MRIIKKSIPIGIDVPFHLSDLSMSLMNIKIPKLLRFLEVYGCICFNVVFVLKYKISYAY